MNEYNLICKNHRNLRVETALSPPRYVCKCCGKRKVQGYTNPNHGSNPFGYLYLAPNICIGCSIKTNKCMWCSYGAVI